MPTAPMAQRQVVDQAFPNVRVSAAPTDDTYGGQIGDTVARASVRMYDLQTRSSDHAAVVEAETRANEEQLRIQQETRGFKGKDASKAPEYAQAEWGKVHEDILGSLGNDRQRAMYHSIGLQKGEIINRGALQHFNQEDDAYQEQTFKANISSSVNVARANAESPTAVAFEKDLQQMRVDEHAAKHGYSGTPQHDEAITAVHSQTNKEVIHGLLDKGQDLRAKAFYDRIMKDEKANPTKLQFTASDRDTVDKAIFEGSTRGASRRVTSELMSKGIETSDDRKARNAELSQLVDSGKIDDKTYDQAKQRLEHEYSHFDQIKNQVKDERFKGAIAGIDEQLKAGNKLPPLDLVRPSDLAEMSVEERHTIETYVNRRRDPGKVVTDLPTMINLYAMKDEDLAKIGKREMTALVMKLDDGDGKSVMTRWNGAINAKSGQKDVKYEQMYSNKELFDQAIKRSGYFDLDTPVSKWSPEKQRLMLKADKEAALAVGKLKEGATTEEIMKVQKQVIDENIGEKFKVKPSFFRFEKDVAAGSIGDYKDARSIRIPLKDIPTDRQDALKGALRSKGLPVTPQNIEELEAKSRMRKQGVR